MPFRPPEGLSEESISSVMDFVSPMGIGYQGLALVEKYGLGPVIKWMKTILKDIPGVSKETAEHVAEERIYDLTMRHIEAKKPLSSALTKGYEKRLLEAYKSPGFNLVPTRFDVPTAYQQGIKVAAKGKPAKSIEVPKMLSYGIDQPEGLRHEVGHAIDTLSGERKNLKRVTSPSRLFKDELLAHRYGSKLAGKSPYDEAQMMEWLRSYEPDLHTRFYRPEKLKIMPKELPKIESRIQQLIEELSLGSYIDPPWLTR